MPTKIHISAKTFMHAHCQIGMHASTLKQHKRMRKHALVHNHVVAASLCDNNVTQDLRHMCEEKKQTQPLDNKTRNTITMKHLPTQLIQYHLLSFCNIETAVTLAQASHQLFASLRHNIHRTEIITSDRFVQLMKQESKQIGRYSCVRVFSVHQLAQLIEHLEQDKRQQNVVEHNGGYSSLNIGNRLCHLNMSFDEPLGNFILPQTLKTLTFGHYFSESLDRVTLPPNLHTLTFGHYFSESLDQVTLPPNLHTLTFGHWFNQSLDRVILPSKLHTLTFGNRFNQSLNQVTLPLNLHTLTFGCWFNQPLDRAQLPPTLHTLTFGSHFNHSLVCLVLPVNLTIRKYGPQLASHLLLPRLRIQYMHTGSSVFMFQ